ncbi:uncharacterized mitochondrial protein AtMg00810-like [Nicotiana tomentosiformis]|uniref:uncharacterized mitochondrial protein AtMg00810-like n=1 Tax=Nicotiana tomentosiformis TaxID=4098 RepID=UPI00388C399A
MKISPGLQVSSSSSPSSQLVCKLKKGYISSKNDYSLFTKSSAGSLVVLAVYVDDIFLAGDELFEMHSLKGFLDDQFKINDVGTIQYFLGLEVFSHSSGYIVSQHKYASDLLAEYHCDNFTPVVTPLDHSVKLSSDVGDLLPYPGSYRKLIGKLNFLQHTRPYISYVVQHLSQFLHFPRVPHMMASLHVLRYISNDLTQEILFSNSIDTSLVTYTNSDWVACATSRKSVSSFYVSLGGCPISWKSKKQPTISLSSAEAEYRVLRMVVVEVSWLIRLLGDMGLSFFSPVPIFYDSQIVTLLGTVLSSGMISLYFVRSSDQLADIFTKALHGASHHSLLDKLGVLSPPNLRGLLKVALFTATNPIKRPN